jgi:hypothetical protein
VSGEFYLALTSLIGVLLGGGLSYAIQRATQRAAERVEAQRQRIAHAEARYAERVAIIDRFLFAVQDAERAAFDRHTAGATGPEWQRNADAAMDRLYVVEKMVRILGTDEFHEVAHVFTNAIQDTLRREPGNFDVATHLMADRTRLLDAARRELERLQAIQLP